MKMKEITIPLSSGRRLNQAEIVVVMPDSAETEHFRIETIPLPENTGNEGSRNRVEQLRRFLSEYSRKWELIQLLDSPKNAGYARMLYRKIQ